MQAGGSSGETFFSKKSKFKKREKKQGQQKKKTCYICDSESHLSNTCPLKKQNNDGKKMEKKKSNTSNAFLAPLLSMSGPNEWYIDSGASSHMSPYGNLIHNKKSSDVNDIDNNEKLKVEGFGNGKMLVNEKTVNVNNILHIPKLSVNLLSVHKLVCSGNRVIFDEDGCKIYNANDELLACCKPVDDVYKLKMRASNETVLLHKMQNQVHCYGTGDLDI